MKNNNMTKRLKILLFALIILAFIMLYFFRIDIYQAIVPNVEITAIGPMFIDGKKYDMTVHNNYIHKKEDDTNYVLLVKDYSAFWYVSNYCFVAEVKIIAQNDMYSAIGFPNNDYKNGDRLITIYNKCLTHGQDVYVINNQ